MKRLIAGMLVAGAVFTARAVVYTWTGGGTSGQWSDANNWSPDDPNASGAPNAGDIAEFSSDAMITEDISIGDGMLVISNAANTAVHLNCVVSGQGGIQKGGAGSLHLYKDNTFTGKFISTGTIDAKYSGGSREHTSCVMIYSGGALGQTAAEFDQDYASGHGSELFINGSVNNISEFVVTVPVLKLTGDDIQVGNLNVSNCTSVTFKGDVSTRARLNFQNNDQPLTFTFEKSVTCSGYNINPTLCTMNYLGPVTNGTFYMSGSSIVTLCTNANVWTSSMELRKRLTLNAENAIDPAHKIVFAQKDNATLDLNGYDQTYSGPAWGTTTYSGGVITSPADKPAMLKLTGGVSANSSFAAKFTGNVSLEWSPTDASRELALTGVFHETRGSFTVGNGTLRVKSGSGFLGLNQLTVAAGATFAANADATAMLASQSLVVEEGGKISLAAGITYTCKSCTFGSDSLADNTYTKADYPDYITGDGTLVVASSSDMVMWSSTGGTDWFDPANWSAGSVPAAGDTVLIGGGTVSLTNSTPRIGKLTVLGATVEFASGWDTCLSADKIELINSTLTCTGPFTNDLQKTRVYVNCGTFTLDGDSTIDMLGKGWKGGFYDVSGGGNNPGAEVRNPDGSTVGGWGPGRVHGDLQGAASHLGLGGVSGISSLRSYTYDDPYAPVEPGSGGRRLKQSAYSRAYYDIGSGGGAVLIEAAGAVVIDGAIKASGNGASTHSHFANSSSCNTAGSGGAVLIRCETISGSGSITANGGNGSNGSQSPPAGGGGIAIECDDEKQAAGACANMKISAAEGVDNTGTHTTYTTGDNGFFTAEPGTVYLSSRKLVDDTLGKSLSGRLVGIADYEVDGDLNFGWGHVRFCETGVAFRVTGDLVITGANSRIDIGGHHSETNWGRRPWVDAGDRLVSLSVGGDLVVSNGAALAVYAAKVVGEAAWGGEVSVGGAFTVGGGSFIYPTSNYGYGGAPHFTASSFTLAADSVVNGTGRGGSGAWNNSTYTAVYTGKSATKGIGVGAGNGLAYPSNTGGGGGGHGGDGGDGMYNNILSSTYAGKAHDDQYLPCQSGSGGGSAGYAAAQDGGGVFHLVCTGPVQIDGEIKVNANNHGTNKDAYIGYYGTGSGGTICIIGSTVSGAATLSARGGNANYGGNVDSKGNPIVVTSAACGLGAGGRVSLWSGGQFFGVRGSKVRHALTASDESLCGGFAGWTGTIDVGGGTNVLQNGVEQITSNWGEDGTVWFNASTEPFGMTILLK